MAKPTQLEFIRDLAQSREQELAVEVGELRRQKNSAEVALNRLDTYLAEYTLDATQNRFRSRLIPGRTVTHVENERHFVKRLSRAVDRQRVHARQCSERVDLKVQSWQRERAQVEALERVVEKRRRLAGRKQRRREQTESDTSTGHRLALKSRSEET